jgi:hypothetical protein
MPTHRIDVKVPKPTIDAIDRLGKVYAKTDPYPGKLPRTWVIHRAIESELQRHIGRGKHG